MEEPTFTIKEVDSLLYTTFTFGLRITQSIVGTLPSDKIKSHVEALANGDLDLYPTTDELVIMFCNQLKATHGPDLVITDEQMNLLRQKFAASTTPQHRQQCASLDKWTAERLLPQMGGDWKLIPT